MASKLFVVFTCVLHVAFATEYYALQKGYLTSDCMSTEVSRLIVQDNACWPQAALGSSTDTGVSDRFFNIISLRLLTEQVYEGIMRLRHFGWIPVYRCRMQ
jgi:hypothetical protein